MSKTIFETVNARIDEILAARDVEITAAERAGAEAKAALEEARSRADAAVVNTDVNAFSVARADAEKAETAMTLYTTRLEQLQGKQVITDEENASTMSDIRAMQKKLMDDASSEIVELLSQIEAIGKQYYADQDALNALVWRWHSEIYSQPHPRSAGLPVYTSDLYANDGDLRHAIRTIVTSYFYRKELGVSQYTGTGKFWTE